MLALVLICSVFLAMGIAWNAMSSFGAWFIQDRLEFIASVTAFLFYILIAGTIWLLYVRIP